MTLSLWPNTAAGTRLCCASCFFLVKHTLIVNDCLPSPLLLIFTVLQVLKALFIFTDMQRIQNTWDQKDFSV